MLKVAVCPARILAFNGCVEMDGATDTGGGGVTPLPTPLRTMEITVPFACVNLSAPEYATAEVGANVTKPVRLCPGFKVTGKAVPE